MPDTPPQHQFEIFPVANGGQREVNARNPLGFSARICMLVIVMVVITTQSGCQIFRRFGSGHVDRIPVVFSELPSQQQLLASLNSKSASVRQLTSNVTVSLPGAPKIKGTLQVEFPNRIRMKAGLLGISEMGVDVGSNQEQFWIWSKASLPGQPPALYYANHDAFQQSPVRQAIPLDPKWLIESFGLVKFDPNDVHHGPTMVPGGRMKLFTVQQTATGPQTRVTLLGTKSGVIEQQAVYDASNRLIAYSNSSNHKNYADQQISLPQRVELHMIQPDGQDVKIVVDLGTYSIGTPNNNVLFGDPAKMWAIPNPGGVPKFDLTRLSNAESPNGYSNNFLPQHGTPATGVGFSQ